MSKQTLFIKTWEGVNAMPTAKGAVRSVINHSKDNYSIQVSQHNTIDFLPDRKTGEPLELSQIEIELPCGLIWTGNITELQTILKPHSL